DNICIKYCSPKAYSKRLYFRDLVVQQYIPVPHRTPQIDSFLTRLPPYSRFTMARVPTIAVNIDVATPIPVVIANPLIAPVPTAYRMMTLISVVMFASKMELNAPR